MYTPGFSFDSIFGALDFGGISLHLNQNEVCLKSKPSKSVSMLKHTKGPRLSLAPDLNSHSLGISC